MEERRIVLRGCREHNLKGFDLELPLYRVICVTGVSGSGKSSLVFDTLFAEGERRYLETFSSYVRQYLERLPRPKVDSIENIPPAIAISQVNPVKSSRSTVGTLSEITHFTKMFYYRVSVPRCPLCGRLVEAEDPVSAARKVFEKLKGEVVVITAPLKPSSFELVKEGLLFQGFHRAYVKDRLVDLEELDSFSGDELEVVVDRVRLEEGNFGRAVEAFEVAFKMAGEARVHYSYFEELRFSSSTRCPYCGKEFPKKVPNLFSFNSPVGACPTCRGFGRVLDIDWSLVIPDEGKSIRDGAITILEMPFAWDVKVDLLEYCRRRDIPVDVPWRDLPQETKDKILYGDGSWYGIKDLFDWLETKRYKAHIRILLSRFRAYLKCKDCEGTRFRKEALLYEVNGRNIAEFYAMPVSEARKFLEEVLKAPFQKAEQLLAREIYRRLRYLEEVGLPYLTLDRQSRTLSGGEVARVLLTRALSSELTETLYLLDEPTTGLHPRDTERVVRFLERLAERGNTAVVVEHDPEVVLSSDLVVDLGPGAGERGGRLLFVGTPKDLLQKDTPTALALKSLPLSKTHPKNERDFERFLVIAGASENNLKGITARFPLGAISVVCGVSGSGKSTLVEVCLYRGLKKLKGEPVEPPGSFKEIKGAEAISKVVLLDQSPLARTPRGNVATYLLVYDLIRALFASSFEAKARGLSRSHFSFNSIEGRCEECEGLGYKVVDMQFLSDLVFVCEACEGKRFKEKVLSVKWKGKSIADVLDMTLEDAVEFFEGHEGIRQRLELAIEVGLGYLKLGQPLSTLSGGEAQRLKLVRALTVKEEGVLFVLDEPTVGLHLKDIESLKRALKEVVSRGHTVVVVEHHPEIILFADWVVELGPEGGEEGGYLIYEGPVEGLKERDTPTGIWLRRYLKGSVSVKRDFEKKRRSNGFIEVRGARHHNLKNIDVEIPRGRFVVITGVSGSGKSTLAFDLIFAEGQRRYIESLPAYMRQFVRLYEEPEVDLISGLPPTVALEQRTSRSGPRSTVGTLVEILPYLRLLYARVSEAFCPRCGRKLSRVPRGLLLKKVLEEFSGEEIKVLAPKVKRRKGFHKPVFERAYALGFREFRVDGEFLSVPPVPELSRYREHTVEVVVDAFKVTEDSVERLESALERGFLEGGGELTIWSLKGEELFNERLSCSECGISLPEPDPLLFSFNTKAGACAKCGGLGVVGAGSCPSCKGARLKEEALAFKIGGKNIAELSDMSVEELNEFLNGLEFSGREAEVAEPILKEVRARLEFLRDVGLGYLSLSRSGESLSGGEAQRVRLAAELGSNLSGVAYILDEPTIGLHPKDTQRLLSALSRLKQRGNTVIVVEHDEEVIRSAELVVDLGPGGGKKGGEVVFVGPPEELLTSERSKTAQALRDESRRRITVRERKFEEFLEVIGATANNLKEISVRIPLNSLTVVCGVSGSGKSSLVEEVLFKGASALVAGRRLPHTVREIKGVEKLKKVLMVDHSPIGRTPRSTPATYVGFMKDIRRLFASTKEARARGYSESRFSFNVEEGRCEACKGHGIVKVEMKFLPEVYQVCEVCGGKRFNEETLSIRWKGKNIAEVLEMTFDEARDFFSSVPSVFKALDILCELGLDYLTLGQPSPTLSGGEAQRIKLATEFVKGGRGGTLYILDEPSTGLHMLDVQKLVRLLHGLVEKGNTVVVIEHNLDVIKEADWIVELGPGGGEAGGRLLFQGPLTEFLKEDTPTASVLKRQLSL